MDDFERGYQSEKEIDTIPVGPLALIPLTGCAELGKMVDRWLVRWRNERESKHKSSIVFEGYQRDTYIVESETPRFGSGEAKGRLKASIRGDDLYLMVDVTNYNVTYSMGGQRNHMSPDDHFQNLKRIIGAANGKAKRINVIMPYLYESRQDIRVGRESLDCAMMLQELEEMGVENIITFDAHDPRVQNAIPLRGFETVPPAYQFIKHLLKHVKDLQIDNEHMMVISPDEGGMKRTVYFANLLGLDMGMFYKRRDYSQEGHPVVAHEFLGTSVEGKDVLIIDDMISSGDSMLDVAKELKRRKAGRIFCCATYGLFTGGLKKFDEYYNDGIIDKLLTTNLMYQPPQLLQKPYYINVDMSKYIALIIDTLNHDDSLSELLNPVERIHRAIERYHAEQSQS